MLADPGVPHSVYRRYTKAKYGKEYKMKYNTISQAETVELKESKPDATV